MHHSNSESCICDLAPLLTTARSGGLPRDPSRIGPGDDQCLDYANQPFVSTELQITTARVTDLAKALELAKSCSDI